MKEQIADWIPALTEEYRLEAANEILTLIRTEIEKVRNPYKSTDGSIKTTEALAWWQACQAVLNLFKGENETSTKETR